MGLLTPPLELGASAGAGAGALLICCSQLCSVPFKGVSLARLTGDCLFSGVHGQALHQSLIEQKICANVHSSTLL